MKKTIAFLTQSCLLILLLVNVSRADTGSNAVQERFKTAVNSMVQQVQAANNPADKREIIGQFLHRMDQSVATVKFLEPLSQKDNQALAAVQNKIRIQCNELNGLNGSDKISDGSLNAYAKYIQQDMEQADTYWTGNGIYISVGTLILILILILILR